MHHIFNFSYLHPELKAIYNRIVYFDEHPNYSLDLVRI